jgi:hypothetical protein
VIKQGPLEGKAVVIIGQSRRISTSNSTAGNGTAGGNRKLLLQTTGTKAATSAAAGSFRKLLGTAEDVKNMSTVAGNSTAAQCPHTFPLITPSTGGSTVFVYHGDAVAQFRELVLTPFFVGVDSSSKLSDSGNVTAKPLDPAQFLSEVTRIGTAHLMTTLDILSPANKIHVFSANYHVSY